MVQAKRGLNGEGAAAFDRQPAIGPREDGWLRRIQEKGRKLNFHVLSRAHQTPHEEHNPAADDQPGAKQRQQNQRNEIGNIHFVSNLRAGLNFSIGYSTGTPPNLNIRPKAEGKHSYRTVHGEPEQRATAKARFDQLAHRQPTG